MQLICLISTALSLALPQQPLTYNNQDGDPDIITFCSSSEDIFVPGTITLKPKIPVRGQRLDFSVNGTFKETIVQGSVARVKVKLGFIQLLDHEYDLCQEIKQVGKECPLEKGPFELISAVDIPKEVPPGHYRVHVEAFQPDTRPISCVNGDFRI